MINLKRAYEPASPADGHRVLVDRIWPRGVSKAELKVERWDRDLAPSAELRRWFGHDPARWAEFRERYRDELGQPDRQALLAEIADTARHDLVTLVYGAHDTAHNQAVVLKEVLGERLQAKRSAGGGQKGNA
ncbi:MAG TPA: DUF488 domain-containing protein [Thermomicrobiaceae bacterium]|nr:DUF488 domain-containing protein [Thermomicrobiaceae bacterium]